MGTRDPRVDAYIASAQPFAREILSYLRELVHETVPAVQEEMKWSRPHFAYNGIFCGMSAFKAHCAFGFWLHDQVMEGEAKTGAAGDLGRITSRADLPSKTKLKGWLKKAKQLQDAGVKRSPDAQKAPKKDRPIVVPPVLAQALAREPAVQARFDAMPPSHRREYCEWIAEAKQEATRERRVAKALEQIAEGKSQNWKYETRKG